MSARGARLVVPLGLLAVVLPAAPGHADPDLGSGFSSYALSASAPGFALEGLYKDVALTVPETTSSLTTGGVGSGLASLAWPGPIVGNAGTTILVLQPAAPPQVTMLNDPVKAQARTAGPQKASYTDLPGTVMAATATPDEVTATSTTGPATTLPVGDVGTLSGTTKVALDGAASAVATARTALQHLTLAAGQVEIGSLVSTASARSDGRTASSQGSTTVTGVRVAGVPVTVDDKGLHVAGQDAPALPVGQVADAVKALGLTVVMTQPREVKQGGSVRYVAAALVVMWTQQGKDYAVTLGRASAGIDASLGGDDAGLDVGTPTGAQPGGSTSAGSAGGPSSSGLTGTGTAVAPSGSSGPLSSLPGPVAAVVGAVTPVVALAAGAPAGLALVLLVAGALLAAVLGRVPGALLVPPPPDCEEPR